MLIENNYGSGSIDDIFAIQRAENNRKYSFISDQTTASGDRVDISDEAKKLYSQMIHKYDKSSGSAERSGDQEGATPQSGSGASAQGGEAADSSDEVESIKKQIQALKSQLMALASQAGESGTGTAMMGKMNALQSQIAALEAQLNAIQQNA